MSAPVKLDDLLDTVRQFREKIQYGAAGQYSESVEKAEESQNELKKEIDKLIGESDNVGKQVS